ncbi:type II toxin-antitoxin system HipA family toxin YjjJ [Limnohabitans sp.]|uniref:type II toxin-antitoxin system HipA family toxin YjjJ n=1 Tax=Limnohabitans sp. TaxID=1907725 RepID=UPI00286F9A04|nr:type II toxin-antitoxin system HipA family toxin YjjJ [Limnohabitans sp.]
MPTHTDLLRLRLAAGPKSGTQMAKDMGISQPTATRVLAAMGSEVMKVGQKKGTRYALRDTGRGFADVPVFRVDAEGKLKELGVLTPVRPDGFVFTQADGVQLHSDGLPWWLLDMRPQGYLGRAYATRYGVELGLPSSLKEWTDSHALRTLLVHGHDLVGNLLLGPIARDKFIATPEPVCLTHADKPSAYARMAIGASQGEAPGSSAGGEQPKFTAYADTGAGPAHVMVKFSEKLDSPISQRWRDLLLAEHLALTTLRQAGVAAAESAVVDFEGQRFLEVGRFDRVGTLGRKAVVSLAALDAEFVGAAHQPWPVVAQRLAAMGAITPEAAETAEVLWAFGVLTGNTDMHSGNLSFVSEHGRPYHLAPTYDMTPMAFAPSSSGKLPDTVPTVTLHASVRNEHWRTALAMAHNYLATLRTCPDFSAEFEVCVDALAAHLESASAQVARLG